MAGLAFALMTASVAAAQNPAPAPGAGSGFRGLWTGWRDANSNSMTLERRRADQVRQEYATGGSERREQMQGQGRALGERVGEIVRLGDCAEGERVARQAGDFALVAAVRAHCGPPKEAR